LGRFRFPACSCTFLLLGVGRERLDLGLCASLAWHGDSNFAIASGDHSSARALFGNDNIAIAIARSDGCAALATSGSGLTDSC
jgi:hypothetical protein